MHHPVRVVISSSHDLRRRQRTPQPVSTPTLPNVTVTYQYPVSEHIGRLPCIGLDTGHIPNTRPDTSPINRR